MRYSFIGGINYTLSKNRYGYLLPGLILVIVLYFYHEILNVFFVQDDFWFLAAVQSFSPKFFFLGVLPDYLRPVPTYWFPLLNRLIWGVNPSGYHISQMLVYLATIYLLYICLLKISGSPLAAAAGTTVYGLSKLHLYTLSWISGAIDVLAAFFFILTFWFMLRYFQGRSSLFWVGFGFGLGLLSKEITIVMPVVYGVGLFSQFLIQRKLPEKKQRNVFLLFLGMASIYLLFWLFLTRDFNMSGRIGGFELSRFRYVLQNSLSVILPVYDYPIRISSFWLAVPLFIAGGLLLLTRKQQNAPVYVGMAISMWVISALIFGMTKKPADLQPYYAHFSVIGIVLLLALFISWVFRLVGFSKRFLFGIQTAFVVLLIGFIFLSGPIIQKGLQNAESPSLKEAALSRAAYNEIRPYLFHQKYQKVVFFQTADIVWWSVGKGAMIPVLFPGTEASFDGFNGFTAPSSLKTDQNTLVLRQVGDLQFEIVK